ncbi:Putative lipoprotein/NMB1164 precursor [Marinomonas aquimarina]|uniref:Curli production assembly/transport component CsgG n=1 Tax=Marinomonas aquimarina TaxID=295068 RepID=A0A1A8TQC9_9GAMM|nr:CsgG/HfaB family protein [Marinomonas aquimarina]SBS35634.1 Putative lipoprotein/NMB1164 precursor [Marinomonas aquimarina]
MTVNRFKPSKIALLSLAAATLVSLSACSATQTHRAVESETVATYRTDYTGMKTTLVVGNFQNRSSYMQGLFSSDIDKLGNQAKTILKTHLQQTNRFKVVDRENLDTLQREAELNGMAQQLTGARYTISGDVTEFGRKVTGDKQLFGILGSGKTQTAYAKVSINIVDVLNGEIVYATQAAGEYELSNREVVGFGSSAGYDATLNGKVLNFAITEAVNNMVRDLESGLWQVQ